MEKTDAQKETHSTKQLNISVESQNSLLTETLLKTFFDEHEIYQYTTSITQDYKEFKEEVILHLNFLDNVCADGLKNKDLMALNGIRNYITSFLIRNNLDDIRELKNK